ncbi:unnamed protein product [Closterium sp. NIES-65]|nr:unnamed protein product [Closterium sp. NIES-65]
MSLPGSLIEGAERRESDAGGEIRLDVDLGGEEGRGEERRRDGAHGAAGGVGGTVEGRGSAGEAETASAVGAGAGAGTGAEGGAGAGAAEAGAAGAAGQAGVLAVTGTAGSEGDSSETASDAAGEAAAMAIIGARGGGAGRAAGAAEGRSETQGGSPTGGNPGEDTDEGARGGGGEGGGGGGGGGGTVTRGSDMHLAARSLEQAVPFAFLLLFVQVRQHLIGFCTVVWLTATLFKANDFIRKQGALKADRNPVLLALAAVLLLAHVAVVNWLFWPEQLWRPLLLIPPAEVPPFWHALFIIVTNDVLVRFAAMAEKCGILVTFSRLPCCILAASSLLLIVCPTPPSPPACPSDVLVRFMAMAVKCGILVAHRRSKGMHNRHQAQVLTLVEYTTLLYRTCLWPTHRLPHRLTPSSPLSSLPHQAQVLTLVEYTSLLYRAWVPAPMWFLASLFLAAQVLTLVEYTSLLYRAWVPAPVWFQFFLNDQAYGRLTASLTAGLYLAFKLSTSLDRVLLFVSAVRQAVGKGEQYGTEATPDEVAAAGNMCAICQEHMTGPVTLRCRHVFCDECVSEW